MTKPILEKYGLMFDQQYDEYMAEGAATLRDKYRQLESAQVDQQIANMPLQQELLERQLDEIRRGGRATDEQKALIAEITQRGIDAGDSDIGEFLSKGLSTIREELAPSRGMRPDDAPIIDQGEELAMEALRQKGLLTSQMRGAQASAELNFPLEASKVFGQQAQFQQGFQSSMNQFLQGLRQQAANNRFQFQSQAFAAPMSAGEQGIGLINASRPTPVSFPRNTSTTEKTSGGGSILGGIGGALSGIAQVGSLFSTKKAKENIKPIEAPPGHLLSPGALKFNIQPVGPAQNGRSSTPTGYKANDITQMHPTANMALDAAVGNNPAGFDPWIAAGNRMQPDEVRDPKFTSGGTPTEEEMLKRIANLEVSTWNYKPGTGLPPDQHIGPMAESFNTQVMQKSPQPYINTVDAIGSLMASVKALEKRTRGVDIGQHRPQHTKFGAAPAGYRGQRRPVGAWRKVA